MVEVKRVREWVHSLSRSVVLRRIQGVIKVLNAYCLYLCALLSYKKIYIQKYNQPINQMIIMRREVLVGWAGLSKRLNADGVFSPPYGDPH